MLGWFSADPSYILNGQYVYMSCLNDLVLTEELVVELSKNMYVHLAEEKKI
jgi:hypothetical protein